MNRRSPAVEAMLERARGSRRNHMTVPLVRFLRSRRGKRWDGVYAELCDGLPEGRLGRRLRGLIDDFVCARVVRHDGVLYGPRRGHGTAPLYSTAGHACRTLFYVHPGDGTLREAPPQPLEPRDDTPPSRVDLGAAGVLIKADGIWYAVELARVPAQATPFDDWLRAAATAQNAGDRQALYGRRQTYAVRKRQLDRRGLRRAGLENDR